MGRWMVMRGRTRRWWRWWQVVSSSLRMYMRPRGDSMNRPYHMCYRVLLMGTWLLYKVRSWRRWRRRRRRDYSSRSWMVNSRALRWQKMPWSNMVSWNCLLACCARKCLIWS